MDLRLLIHLRFSNYGVIKRIESEVGHIPLPVFLYYTCRKQHFAQTNTSQLDELVVVVGFSKQQETSGHVNSII